MSSQTALTVETAQPLSPDRVRPLLLVVLALLSTVAPFATDLYLPAFPRMTGDLATDATGVQMTLTSFLVGIAFGQLGFGPLSDKFGRKLPLMAGSLLCLVASAVAALAPNVEVLIAARFVQGVAGAAGMVIGRAIISDLATGKAAARAFNLMMIVSGVAPVVAPVLGGIFVDPLGWRGILWVIFGLAALMLVSVSSVIRESHTLDRRAKNRAVRAAQGSALHQLRSRVYIGNTLTLAFSFAVMMAYISASPFLYQVMMGVNALQYGLFFGVNALGLVAVSGLAARLVAVHSVRRVLGAGLALVLASALGFVLLVLLGASPVWLAAPVFAAISSLGLVFGNATSLALAEVPRAAGTGSAVLGALQFGVGALVSPLVSIGGEDTALPLAVVMIGASTLAAAAFYFARARKQPAPRS
ncbi:multidrug effflux MFS transporter [Pseudarthrobacter oxydans]|uniref:multidrug effflux MFS transporter n=1 Tax=Pseudarthrobacter oxydans TaxID=1671 RepID=UPI003810A75D